MGINKRARRISILRVHVVFLWESLLGSPECGRSDQKKSRAVACLGSNEGLRTGGTAVRAPPHISVRFGDWISLDGPAMLFVDPCSAQIQLQW